MTVAASLPSIIRQIGYPLCLNRGSRRSINLSLYRFGISRYRYGHSEYRRINMKTNVTCDTIVIEDALPDDIARCFVDTGLDADKVGRFDAYAGSTMVPFENYGTSANQVAYSGFINFIDQAYPNVDAVVYTTNEMLVKQVSGEWKVNEPALVPLWERLLEALAKKPCVKIAFMRKIQLMANIRRVQAEIVKLQAEAAVDPDDYDYDDDDSECPW